MTLVIIANAVLAIVLLTALVGFQAWAIWSSAPRQDTALRKVTRSRQSHAPNRGVGTLRGRTRSEA